MEKQIEFRGKKIFYQLLGQGMPVTLIHGFGTDSSTWNNQIEYLKDKYQLIVPDLPGSGKSDMINDMSIEGMAEVVKAILSPLLTSPGVGGLANTQGQLRGDSLIKDNFSYPESSQVPPPGVFRGACIMIGHSMGGYITLAFAEKYPELLKGFGLFHSTAFADSEEKKAIRKKGIEFINHQGPSKFLKTSIPNLFSPFTKENNPELIAGQIEKADNFSGPVLVSYCESMIQRPDRTEVLKKAKIPVLFIISEHDTTVPIEESLKQCHLPERSYIHILKNSGHMGMCEEPIESNRILEEFLQNL